MPWWGWTLVGWTGLSIVLGLLIGRWRKSVRLTEEERAWPIRKADEQVPGKETALYSARCPVCDQERPLGGPDGVIVHLLAIHPDSTEARWVITQLVNSQGSFRLMALRCQRVMSPPTSRVSSSRRPSQCVHRHRECPPKPPTVNCFCPR